VVSRVFIDNHSVFDPAALPEDPRVRWAYRLANRIHVRTRPDFIRDELLLAPGDCHDPRLARESARILREFRFIASADVYGVPQPDGTRHLVVETRDEWTTKLSGDIRFDGGLDVRGVQVVEENFMGRGILLGAFWWEDDERRDVGARFELPRIRGSNWDVATSGARTRVGQAWSQTVIHPFVGEVGTVAFRQRASLRQDLYTWVLPPLPPEMAPGPGSDPGGWSHLVAPLETGRVEVAAARRFGSPGRFLLLGGGLSREWIRPGTREQVEGVQDGRFEERLPVPGPLVAPLLPQLGTREVDRVSVLVGVRRVDFVERRGLDAVRGLQDVATGREILLSVGPALRSRARRTLEPDAASPPLTSGPRDLFLGLDGFAGGAWDPGVAQLHLSLQTRRAPDPQFSTLPSEEGAQERSPPTAWQDLLGEAHAFFYLQEPGSLDGHTFLFRASALGGWRTRAPFQLTLGGADGVRGWDESLFPGARRVVLTLEDRIQLRSPLPHLGDLGMTLLADAGRILPGDAPWGEDSGWRGSVGAGLRLGFPAGSGSVIRFDLAFPLGPGAGSTPRLLISARDLVGLLGGFESEAMSRVRRSGLRPQFAGVSREPLGR
jgi:hypothetical protein